MTAVEAPPAPFALHTGVMAKRISKPKKPTGIFQLHVELEGIVPSVWRRVLVPSNINLAALHAILNEVMGWTNSHLHQFRLRDRLFGDTSMPDAEELEFEDEKKVQLNDLVGIGNTIIYEYDFGDSWAHRVKVEKMLAVDERLRYPLCVAGARACPPEDCGGVGGYEQLLESLQDPKAEGHSDSLTWVGGHFDPEGFDVNRTNQVLGEQRRR